MLKKTRNRSFTHDCHTENYNVKYSYVGYCHNVKADIIKMVIIYILIHIGIIGDYIQV